MGKKKELVFQTASTHEMPGGCDGLFVILLCWEVEARKVPEQAG